MHATDDTACLVALLARAGVARDRLREGVSAAGGHIVLEEDPNTLDLAALQAAAPQVVLVALEPAVEDALEQLETVLESGQYNLMFEEAELAARREGWEAQRWVRHLAAKLQGHANVLPPGQESDTDVAPGAPEQAPAPEQQQEQPAQPESHAGLQFDPALAEAGDFASAAFSPPPVQREAPADVLSFEELIASAAPPAQFAEESVDSGTRGMPPPLPSASEQPAAGTPATPVVGKGFSEWSLLEDDAYTEAAPAVEVAAEPPPALASLLNSSLSLVELEETADGGSRNAVLLVAGIGGPDAVRRVLAGLPEDFNRPVLVQLRLDGGRYANLVKQMSRAAVLPVALADPGQALQQGNIYILPDGIGLASEASGLVFSATASDLLSALQPEGSAVLLLSGADVALVEPVLAFAGSGGWVAGQVGEGCYDPAAASQLAVAGMLAGDPEHLVAELAAHCGN